MPEIYAVVHATERSVFDTGAPPADQIIQRLRSVGPTQGGHWVGPAPRIVKIIRTGNYRAWETHVAWVYAWPDTVNRAAVETNLQTAVARILGVGDSDWTVAIESYSPVINGPITWWEAGQAAQTRTRDQFATATGRLDPDENPTGPTTPLTHPRAPIDLVPNVPNTGDLKVLGAIAIGVLGLIYLGPAIGAAAKRSASKPRSNPTDMEVAETILRQMGGAGRLKMMIGAKDFVGDKDSVQFRWAARSKNLANKLRVTLLPSDTYRMDFYRVKRAGRELAPVSSHEGVYAEDLVPIFERETGLYTRLNHRKRANPPLMEGSSAADLRRDIDAYVKKITAVQSDLKYDVTGNGDLEVSGRVDNDSIGKIGHLFPSDKRLSQIASRHGFRFSTTGTKLRFLAL